MTICQAVFIQYRDVTDGRTDGWTDRIAISISRVSVLTRDKNLMNELFCVAVTKCLIFIMNEQNKLIPDLNSLPGPNSAPSFFTLIRTSISEMIRKLPLVKA